MTVETERDVRAWPLSLAQEQLWFLDQLAPGEATYTIQMVWRLRGPLRVDLLRRSLNLVVARHDSLRVTIHSDDGVPYQVVGEPADVPLAVIDLSRLGAAERERRVRAEIDALLTGPFDLGAGPLCRFRLLRISADEHVLCQVFHHIVTDGWSIAITNDELSATYRGLHAGTGPALDDPSLSFTEFAASQRERLRGELLAEELAFWRRRLADLPVLEIPADRPRPVGGSHAGETLIRELPAGLRDLVKGLADSNGVSMFMILAAAFSIVLGRYSGRDDVPTGVPMLGRPEPEMEALVGMFINMTVLRADLSGDPTFSDLIERIADRTLELHEHQEVAFNQVVEAVQPIRDPDRNPLFQVSIQLLGASNSGESLDLTDVAAEFIPLTSATSRFDAAINVIDTGTVLRANVEYSSDMYDQWRMEAMLGHLEAVLRAAAADPTRRISQIPMVTGAEREALLAAGAAIPGRGQVYVVDPAMNLVPRGVPGDVVAADGPGGPLTDGHRTGERARWSADLRFEPVEASADDGEAAVSAVAGGTALTATERRVAAVFGEVLSLSDVGVEDNFFLIGGNSLHAMRAVSRINKAFGIKLSVRALYGNTSVRTVSAAVDEKLGECT